MSFKDAWEKAGERVAKQTATETKAQAPSVAAIETAYNDVERALQDGERKLIELEALLDELGHLNPHITRMGGAAALPPLLGRKEVSGDAA